MKAIVIDSFGGPEKLTLVDLPKPKPGPGQALVKVLACGLNPVDAKIRGGRLPLEFSFPLVLGYDISGVVEAVGEEVEDLEPGDEVFYTSELTSQGAYAEYQAVDAELVAMKPVDLTHPEAASIPLAGCTAWQALFHRAGLQAGEMVLVHGGAGGVGSLAVQLASWAGCDVMATCSAANAELVAEMGADLVIDYKSRDFVAEALEATDGEGVDVVLDTVGGETLIRSFEALGHGGCLVSLVPENLAGIPLEAIAPGYFKNAELHLHLMERDVETLDSLARLLERGLLTPLLAETIPFDASRLAAAHGSLEGGHTRGKIVMSLE
jgi:NADPH:quinone reductase-like Zn-dependent oxidoreductase